MKISIEDWLHVQLGREDLIGKLARSWFESTLCNSSLKTLFRDWWDIGGSCEFTDEEYQMVWCAYEKALQDLESGISPDSFPSALANEAILDALNKSIDWHSKDSNLTSEKYLHIRHLELREYVKSKTTLYLDTGYWVGMRTINRGRNNK